MTPYLSAQSSRFILIHYLIARMHANRNEDGTLKSLEFAGTTRLRSSSQTNKFAARYNDDPVTGIASIKLPDGTNVAETIPSKGHFNTVLKKLSDIAMDEGTKKLVVLALYKALVGEKGSKGKADKAKGKAENDLKNAQENIVELQSKIEKSTDAKEKGKLERTLKTKQEREVKLRMDIAGAGGEVELSDEESELVETAAGTFETKQTLILSDAEVDRLADLSKRSLKIYGEQDPKKRDQFKAVRLAINEWRRENGDEWKTIQLGCGLQAAVFGRPTYNSELTQTIEHAAVGYSNLLTVHEQNVSFDTFTAIDKLVKQNTMVGAAMFGEQPIAWGMFYGFIYIDTHTLIRNVEGGKLVDSPLAAEIVRRLILTTASVNPRTKEGSLAAKNNASCLLVEVSDAQPANLSDAFLEPIEVDDDYPDMKTNTFNRLAQFLEVRGKAHSLWNANKRAMLIEAMNPTRLTEVVPTVLSDVEVADWAVKTANGEVQKPVETVKSAPKTNGHKTVSAGV